jgi:outer membrane protein assembly factor BamB
MAGASAFFPISGDRIAAYDLHTGALKWLVDIKTSLQPAAGDGLLFVIEPEALTALRQDDGSVAWRLPLADAITTAPVWDIGWLIVSTSAGNVLAFRAADGVLIWRRELGTTLHAPPALAADRVYLPTDASKVVALKVDTGAVIWERALGGQPNEILALEQRIFVGSNDNYLYCLDAARGLVAWRVPTGADVVGAPVADEDRVYFVSYDNVLRALNRSNGSQKWKRPLALRPTRGVVRAGDAVIVSGVARNAPGFALKDGTPVGDVPAGAELATMPYVLDDTTPPMLVIVTSDFADGTIVRALKRSYEPPSGTLNGPLPNAIQVPRPAGAPPEPAATSSTSPTAPSAPAPDPATPRPGPSIQPPR